MANSLTASKTVLRRWRRETDPYDLAEAAMTDSRPFDLALFGEAAIDPDTAKLNAQMIQLLTGEPEW
jgi:hypothetical protein